MVGVKEGRPYKRWCGVTGGPWTKSRPRPLRASAPPRPVRASAPPRPVRRDPGRSNETEWHLWWVVVVVVPRVSKEGRGWGTDSLLTSLGSDSARPDPIWRLSAPRDPRRMVSELEKGVSFRDVE